MKKVIAVCIVFTMSLLSFQVGNLQFGNEAEARIRFMSDESGGTENCIGKTRVKTSSSISVVPLSLSIDEEYETWKGTQGTCQDASIWRACRTKCKPS